MKALLVIGVMLIVAGLCAIHLSMNPLTISGTFTDNEGTSRYST